MGMPCLKIPHFNHLVLMGYILYLPAQPVSLGILQLISICSLYFFLVFYTICGYLLSLILLLSEVHISLLYMNWDGGNRILLAVH